MVALEIESIFPNLRGTDWSITSHCDARYNCIAWAADETHVAWWPDPYKIAYWPAEAPREVSVEAFIRAFETIGYMRGATDQLHAGFEKVAIYALNGEPKHAAKQTLAGKWSSKLGKEVDIEHEWNGLDDTIYGKIVHVLKRQIASDDRKEHSR